MNLTQLRAFAALAEHGNFSRAAEALGVTQPAVSNHVKALEESYGVKLYHRNGQRIALTELGHELIAQSRRAFGVLDDIEHSLKAAGDLQHGYLSVGTSCHSFVMDVLARFIQRYPGVQVKARIGGSNSLRQSVLECKLDVAAVTLTEPDPRLCSYLYRDEKLVAFVRDDHPWAKRKTLRVKDLAGQPMVLREPGSMTRKILEDSLAGLGLSWRIALELDSWEANKEAVAAGIGIGVALMSELTGDDRLIALRIRDAGTKLGQYIICLPEYEALRTVRAFLDLAVKRPQAA